MIETIGTSEGDLRVRVSPQGGAVIDAYFRDLPILGEDYFCFEPITHGASGQNLPACAGLKRLEPGNVFLPHFA